MPNPYILTIVTVILIAGGQILFKLTAQRMSGRPILNTLTDTSVLVTFIFALGIYGFATILWILALRDLPLARAYFLMSLSFVFVPVISTLVFSERFTPGFAAGALLIVAGVVISQLWN